MANEWTEWEEVPETMTPEELAAIHVRVEAAMAIVRALAETDPVLYTAQPMYCAFRCGGRVLGGEEGTHYFEHGASCPVIRARALLAGEKTPGTVPAPDSLSARLLVPDIAGKGDTVSFRKGGRGMLGEVHQVMHARSGAVYLVMASAGKLYAVMAQDAHVVRRKGDA